MITENYITNFWKHVAKKSISDCWLWLASVDRDGYGKFKFVQHNGVKRSGFSHRFSWELKNGSFSESFYVRHSCTNASCVNPSHLYLDRRGRKLGTGKGEVLRFWKLVDKRGVDDCWPWLGVRITKMRYGYFRLDDYNGKRRNQTAHRFSWDLHNGSIKKGLCICHHCDNPPCVNPKHLFIGTIADNNRDMYRKGRDQHSKNIARMKGV